MDNTEVLKPKIYSVSELNFNIRKNLESNFFDILIEGEVSNFYFHNQKHMYFDLKDEYSKIKVVMFYENSKNLIFDIEDGLHIIVNGYISVYEKRGEYQLVALGAKPVGKGALILAFEQLKSKLEKRGYFDKKYKKNIPVIPRKIGVATSIGGSVLRDMVSVLFRRFENFHLIVRNVNVQGLVSGDEICDAIDELCNYGVDVIIIARGGGSLEDLWAYNSEKLADKIFGCTVPVISAIGHETDFTISDFVADVRAATPSVAAEIVIINKAEAIKNLNKLVKKMESLVKTKNLIYRRELGFLIKRKYFKKPSVIFLDFGQQLDNLDIELKEGIKRVLENKKKVLDSKKQLLSGKDILKRIKSTRIITGNIYNRLSYVLENNINFRKNKLKLLLESLHGKSPIVLLKKGFSILYHKYTDRAIRSIEEVDKGEDIRILLKDGILFSKVMDKLHKKFDMEYENGNWKNEL